MRRLAVIGVLAWAVTWLVNRSLRRVEGSSMLPTLWPDDLLLTVPPRLAGGLRRDDVVVARTPSGSATKRLAGLPGEAVLTGESHRHVAGTWHRQATSSSRHPDRLVITPSRDEVVLLGDHPAASTDSRTHGPVAVTNVQRVALARLRPVTWLRARSPRPLDGPRRRLTVRVVALDAEDRALLFQVRDADGSGETWWETPGGGLEPGEDPITAARRELTEEVGSEPAAVIDLHRVVERDTTIADAQLVKVEHVVAARLPATTVDPAGWTATEVEDIVTWRWWTAEELASTNDPVVPSGLVDLLREARTALA